MCVADHDLTKGVILCACTKTINAMGTSKLLHNSVYKHFGLPLLRTCTVGGPTDPGGGPTDLGRGPTDPGGGPEVSVGGRDLGKAIGNTPSLLQLSLIEDWTRR